MIQQELDKFLGSMNKAYSFLNTLQEVNMVMVSPTIKTATKRTCFLERGLKVKVALDRLWDCEKPDDATHEIVKVFGAGTHSFSILVKDLLTNKESKIDLPNF